MRNLLPIVFVLTFLVSCKKQDKPVFNKTLYPKETPRVVYDYSEDGYVSREMYDCDLTFYEGKTVKSIKTFDTDVMIMFDDGSYMYMDVYKYHPKLKFFKK